MCLYTASCDSGNYSNISYQYNCVTDYTKLYFLAVTTAQLTVNICEQKSLYVDKICCQWNNSVYSMHGASLYKIILEIHIFAS